MDNKKYLEMVKRNGMFLEEVPMEMQTDEVIDAAMEEDLRAFQFIRDKKKSTLERCLEAVRGLEFLFKFVPEDMHDRVKEELKSMTKEREEQLINIVKDRWDLFENIVKEEQTDEIIDIAMDVDVRAFRDIKDESKKTYDRCLRAVKGCVGSLKYVPEEMQTDEIIDISMRNSLYAFKWIKNDNMKTLERSLMAVRGYGLLLGYVPIEMQTDEIIDAAMSNNLWAFEWIKDESKKTYERSLMAVRGFRGYGLLLEFVPEEMQTDEIIDIAMGNYIDAFKYIKDEKKKTLERCLRAVRGDGELIYYVPDGMRERVKEELGL